MKASGEFFLREAERAADQLDLRRAFHALEVGGVSGTASGSRVAAA